MITSSLLILVYHSVNDLSEDRIREPNICTPANFAEQMRYLSASASVIALESALSGEPLPRNAVAITFDDGYRDNLTRALPVLRQYGFPATFFLTTGHIGTGRLKWEDRLNCLMRRSRSETLVTADGPVSIRTAPEKRRVTGLLVRRWSRHTDAERELLIAQAKEQLGVEEAETVDVMLTWDDVRQMAKTPGVSIGAHSVTHPRLTRIAPEDAAREVAASQQGIADQIQEPVNLFAYPYGDWSEHLIEVLKARGFHGAATMAYGRNRPGGDAFRLKRVQVPNRSGRRFQWGLALRGSPFGETLRRGYNLMRGEASPRES